MKWKKNEAQNSEARIEKLADEVRSAACKSMEALWSAFLEVGELDMVRATETTLRLLVSHGDCTRAMKVLEGVYTLVEIAPPEVFTDCQQYPALAQMFMEEFLVEREDFIFDAGIDDVLALLIDESQTTVRSASCGGGSLRFGRCSGGCLRKWCASAWKKVW